MVKEPLWLGFFDRGTARPAGEADGLEGWPAGVTAPSNLPNGIWRLAILAILTLDAS